MRAYVEKWNADTVNPARQKFTRGAIEARRHGVGSIRVDSHGPCFSEDGKSAGVPACVMAGFRDVGVSSDILSLRHNGWYMDAYCGETYAGHVWQLPARDGSPVYLAGYVEHESDYCVLDCTRGRISLFDCKEDAAHAADELARINAEREREHDERWQEVSRIADKREEARGIVKDMRHVARDIIRVWRDQLNTGPLSPSVCSILRADLEEARQGMRKAIAQIFENSSQIDALDMNGEFQ